MKLSYKIYKIWIYDDYHYKHNNNYIYDKLYDKTYKLK